MFGLSAFRVTHLCGILVGVVSAQSIDWVDCSKNVPLPATFLNITGVNLSSLPSTLHCGQLVVPMDYSKPISASNNITLGLAMNRPTNPKGVIFFCPGGTDAGAADAWRVALNQTGDYFPDFSGLLDYDLMMMDIRGTWSSNILNVSLALVEAITVPFPTNQSEYDAIVAASTALIQSFNESSSPPGIVQFTGTNEVVQDFESIRKALNYTKINFLGLSYGAYRALHYADKYPEHVGNFILDATAPPGMALLEQANTEILAENRALLRADVYCQNDPNCPLRNGTGTVPEVYGEILASVSNSTTDINSTSDTFLFQFTVNGALQDQPVFSALNLALAELAGGNSSAFGSGGSLTINDVVAIPYLCSDYEIENNTFAGFQETLKAGSALDTNKIGQAAAWNIRMYCASWPYKVAPRKNLFIKAPMLFVTADFDASAPTEWTTYAWNNSCNSALVVRHGDDHTTFNLPASLATEIEKEFLRTGVLPAPQNGSVVTIYPPGNNRAPISDPYDVPTGIIAGDCPTVDGCNLN